MAKNDVKCSHCGWEGAIGEMKYEVSKRGGCWVCPKCGHKGKLRL